LKTIGHEQINLEGFDDDRDVWDITVPVEKSSYLHDSSVQYFNVHTFEYDNSKLAMLDLFCGAGGFAVGASWNGFQSVFGIDHLEPAIETWSYNHPNSIACLGDIRQVNPDEIKALLTSKGVTKIDLLTGGVPCQGFSIANRKHNDNDERNFLFLEYMRFVKCFMPDYIILENVSGMRSTAGGHFENQIRSEMESLGYTVSVKLVNAADYGVPQIRLRLLFVGVKKDAGLVQSYQFPEPVFTKPYRTVEDAISDLPALENDESATSYSKPAITDYQRLMRGEGTISIAKPIELFNHTAPNHQPEVLKKISQTIPGKPMYEKFKQRIRLNKDEPSPTQLAGGIRPQFQFGHPTQIRGLSIRERARIQSFPDSYVFKGGIVQERVQTGNAVPPLLIYHITKPIAEDLRKRR
jgi:DNA (cytosine-5)-methyltransferase 1